MVRAMRGLAAALWLLPAGPGSGRAEIIDRTHLLELDDSSAHGSTIRHIRRGTYELSDGLPLTMREWYSPEVPELTLRMLTEVAEGFGITWGLSTGEEGPKYRIDPALHLGFILQEEVWRNATLTLTASTLLGGDLSERPCEADYGEFGSMKVNCRLAATTLAPEETLDYLLESSGRKASWVSLQFEYRF